MKFILFTLTLSLILLAGCQKQAPLNPSASDLKASTASEVKLQINGNAANK